MSDSELKYLIDFHLKADRQGPGSTADTLRALALTPLATQQNLRIADIGCGTGGQTLTLAQQLDGHITAVDMFPEFLAELEQRATAAGLNNNKSPVAATMENLPFEPNAFDLIWSEGAIYSMGFENGIKQWKKFLKPGGYLAVSEITWIANHRPAAIEDFWNEQYPEIATAATKIAQLEANGYTLAGYFYLPTTSWTQGYYAPMEPEFDAYLARHTHAEAAQATVQAHKEEMDLYAQYKQYYSYGFYVAQKDVK